MGAYEDLWHLWGSFGSHWHLWGPLDQWGPIGTYGDLVGPMGAYGAPWGPMGTFGALWRPLGSFADLWGHTGRDLWGRMGTYGALFRIMVVLRRLKLHGQNAPKTASPRHCEKIVLLGGNPKHKNQKSCEKQLTGPFSFIFKKNRLPGKMIYFHQNEVLFWENHDFLFPIPLMLCNKNTHELSIFWKTSFRKLCCTLHDKKHFLAPLLCVRPRANTNTTAQ